MKAALVLGHYLKPYWKWILLAPALMTIEVTMDLLQPRLIQRIVDEGVAQLDLALVIQSGLLMIGLAVVGAVGGITNGVFAVQVAQSFGADVRAMLFRHVQQLSFANLDELDTGQWITRLTNDVTQVQEAVHILLRIMVRSPLLMIGSLVMAITTSPQLAFLPAVLIPILLVALIWIIHRATPLFARVQDRLDHLNSVMQENLAGVRVVRAFVRSDREVDRFGAANDALMDETVRVARTITIILPFMLLTLNLGTVGVLWFGGIEVTQGTMHVGQLIAFINYLTITLFSLMMVSGLVIQVARALASADRIDAVLRMRPKVQGRANAPAAAVLQGRVEFQNVTFRYDDRSPDPVLCDVSFVAEPGQTVAFLGTTGAGKSTLVQLIPRLYDVTGGRVLIDGMDVRDMNLESLRRRIGFALQETILFSGTIRDNIRYGRPDAPDEEVVAAARAAQAHDFVMSFAAGYDTVLGQRGVNLSGGQKQRIAIARALVVRPAILILDDSTSAVDVETEARLQAALAEIMRHRTRLVIAQRVSTVLNADKIVVLDNGRVAAQGTHAQLVASSPIYRDIYDSQLGAQVSIHA